LTTLKALKELRCDIVPDLLAYQEGSKPKIVLFREVISLMWSGIKCPGSL
jgi:hypothetical protein